MVYHLKKTGSTLFGEIELAGSKSISNRVLIIRALSPQPFEIHRLANAKDSRLMQELLASDHPVRDAGAAGTTFRFLTAYLAFQPGTQTLTGTERMKQRPVGVLVEALRQLGADIIYLEKEGYPPLRIGEPLGKKVGNRLSISAGTSSQYISALLMMAPSLPDGLQLTLEGAIVSRPYIEMTLQLMAYFGIDYRWEGATIEIPPQSYRPRSFVVEADWSAASYYYALAAFSQESDLHLKGLFANSLQGDAVLVDMMRPFGVDTTFAGEGIRLTKNGRKPPLTWEWDFLRCPDLAQTLAVVCAGLGTEGMFSGLETLRIKETDRIAALQQELAKVDVRLTPLSSHQCRIEGKARVNGTPVFATYEDHRMAMAFAPLAKFGAIAIEDPLVVEKSYPDFWEDWGKLGLTSQA